MIKYIKANKSPIIYEDDTIVVTDTGRDYDFIATVENIDRTYPIRIKFTGDFDYIEPIEIDANDWIGILADDEGIDEIHAFMTNNFVYEYPQE